MNRFGQRQTDCQSDAPSKKIWELDLIPTHLVPMHSDIGHNALDLFFVERFLPERQPQFEFVK